MEAHWQLINSAWVCRPVQGRQKVAAYYAGTLHCISLGTAAMSGWLYLQVTLCRHWIADNLLRVMSATGAQRSPCWCIRAQTFLVALAAGESQADIESLSVLLGVDTVHEDLHRAVTMWRSYDSGGGQQEGTVGESCCVRAGRRPPVSNNFNGAARWTEGF